MSVFTDILCPHFQTLSPDLRGYGRSRAPGPFAMEQHLDDLSTVLFSLDQPCLLLGWSLGGILAMELALKAWFVFGHDTSEVILSHDLCKLFDGLKSESQTELDIAFRKNIVPNYRYGFPFEFGFKDVLEKHADAFIQWRYKHEITHAMFETGAFIATLELVIQELRARYQIRNVNPS